MGLGMFPSSPIRPRFALDLDHLLWASTVFVHGVPNVSAWGAALTSYLVQKGYDVPSEVRVYAAYYLVRNQYVDFVYSFILRTHCVAHAERR